MASPETKAYSWWRDFIIEDRKANYLISSSQDLLDRDFINHAFASPEMPWARPLETTHLEAMLAHSQTFGLYRCTSTSSSANTIPSGKDVQQVGMARFVTDYITTIYLCDVYVVPELRGTGLGKWLVQCCNKATESAPALRRVILHANPAKKTFYNQELGVWDVEEEREQVVVMTRRTYPLQ